jgi:hypothetical protein
MEINVEKPIILPMNSNVCFGVQAVPNQYCPTSIASRFGKPYAGTRLAD